LPQVDVRDYVREKGKNMKMNAAVIRVFAPPALACLAVLVLTSSCAHTQTPYLSDNKYMAIDATKLVLPAYIKDFAGKRVVFTANDIVATEINLGYGKKWVTFTGAVDKNSHIVYLVVPKEQAEGLLHSSEGRFYGKAVRSGRIPSRKSGDSLIVEVHRIGTVKEQ
jgi:hypothetical protein